MLIPVCRLLLSGCILCSVSMAHAEIYKCTDANGKVIFSDKACGTNAHAVELAPLNTVSGADEIEYSDKADLLVCPGGHGTVLPSKLCKDPGRNDCQFRLGYLINLITDINTLKNDISDAQIDLIEKYYRNGTELWEFGTPGREWDAGTGIRGYVVIRRTKPVFYMATLYQGLPSKGPNGSVRRLPLKGRHLKRCKDKSIMDRE